MDSTAKQIARRRIQVLFEQAERTCKENPKLAQRYVESARRVAMAARLRLPATYKRRICKSCNTLLVPGYNARVRIRARRETHTVVTCLCCGNQVRIPLRTKTEIKKEKAES